MPRYAAFDVTTWADLTGAQACLVIPKIFSKAFFIVDFLKKQHVLSKSIGRQDEMLVPQDVLVLVRKFRLQKPRTKAP